MLDDILRNTTHGVTPWRLRAGLIKIRIVIKPGNPPAISPVDLFYARADPALLSQHKIYSGNDIFIGSNETTSDSTDSDYCVGFAGNDTFYGNAGGATAWDSFLGGDGIDTAVYRGVKSNYSIGVVTSTFWNHLTGNND